MCKKTQKKVLEPNNIVLAFLELREAWFHAKLENNAYEGKFENVEMKEIRKLRNLALKKEYDLQTIAIIEGKNVPYAPKTPSALFV